MPAPSRQRRSEPAGDPAGLLAIDKPAGLTSHDIVDAVRRHMRIKRAGHLGTLDPGATGLLLIATGAATRAIASWQGGEKTYEAALRFGVVTSTQDLHGEVIESSGRTPPETEARAMAATFVGETDQLPPMVSAIKVGGERLYDLARRGIEVERQSRRITVRSWEWLEFSGDTARFRVVCSGGTYVRTLAHDLGQRLGCGAAIAELRRLRSEPFGLDRSIGLAELEASPAPHIWERAGLTLDAALAHLPALRLAAAEAAEIGFGGRPRVSSGRASGLPLHGGARSVALQDESGRVVALGELLAAPDTQLVGEAVSVVVHAQVVFPWGAREGRVR